jgi:phage-related protein
VPPVEVVFYREAEGRSPVGEWLSALLASNPRAHAKCEVRIERLVAEGHELRRPEADYLCDGLFELRARQGHVNYRILYAFYGRGTAVLLHALTKEDVIPPADLRLALERRRRLEHDPHRHIGET